MEILDLKQELLTANWGSPALGENIPFATMNILFEFAPVKLRHKKTGHNVPGFQYGGAKRDRTADLHTASVALSQLSYGPNPSTLFCEGAAFRHSQVSLSI